MVITTEEQQKETLQRSQQELGTEIIKKHRARLFSLSLEALCTKLQCTVEEREKSDHFNCSTLGSLLLNCFCNLCFSADKLLSSEALSN